MLENGIVQQVRSGEVDVLMASSAECAGCNGGCSEGAGGARLLEGVLDQLGAHVGDSVTVETSIEARHRAQLLIYVVPVVALVLGYLAGYLLGNVAGVNPDSLGALVAIASAVAVLWGLRKRSSEGSGGMGGAPYLHAIIAEANRPADTMCDGPGDSPPS